MWCVVKRAGGRATVERLERGRLHLDVVALVQEAADGGDHLRPLPEGGAHLGIHDEVHVALAVPEFLVGDLVEDLAVHLFRKRNRPDAFGQKHDLVGLDRYLAHLGAEDRAAHADDVADVEVPLDDGVVKPFRLAGRLQVVALEVELDLARLVQQVGEHHLAFAADRAEPAGDGDAERFGAVLLGIVLRVVVAVEDVGGSVRDLPRGGGVRVHAEVAEGGEGLAADGFLFRQVGHGGSGRMSRRSPENRDARAGVSGATCEDRARFVPALWRRFS